jgi:hypothetical protein
MKVVLKDESGFLKDESGIEPPIAHVPPGGNTEGARHS